MINVDMTLNLPKLHAAVHTSGAFSCNSQIQYKSQTFPSSQGQVRAEWRMPPLLLYHLESYSL